MKRSLGHLSAMDPNDWRDTPDYMLGPFWVGDFAPDLKTRDYGSNDFHGRFHPAIPYVAMKRFTKPGDFVWDCFAGSGTTLDVAKSIDRHAICSDLYPDRDDVMCQDARSWNPGVGNIDLGIMHPPYWDIIDYGCDMSSAIDIEEYIVVFDECMHNMNISLGFGKVVVLVAGEIWKNGELYPLDYELDNLIRGDYGYRLIGRIVKDFGLQTKGGDLTPNKSTNLWKYRLLKYGYFRYGIDTVLFYQKR